ncbi:DUF7146 domain-containing protein [Brevundimonas aurifodinae]|uniref:Toprim domain-containing protein n=1 Tax=Brevundimonas aurifodinae TaxID=1508312 RepID=A0ABV1NN92_9CAUL
MAETASKLARRLADQAEAVCRQYLSKGRREGRYWLVGDVQNAPGRSLYVRLGGGEPGGGAIGKWTDAATGEHGDLLDVIRQSCGLTDFKDVADEARLFLSLPRSRPQSSSQSQRPRAPTGSRQAARRLFAMSKTILGTSVETYLHGRGITDLHGTASLRFHPRCYYRPDETAPTQTWPAMIASVSDLKGEQTGAHRTWLSPDGRGKAPIETPRRAMGELLGHAVRFGAIDEIMAAGEGIETVLSLRQGLPGLPMAAALSAAHLAAIAFPEPLRRLYIVRDNDPAGDAARDVLIARAQAVGIEALVLSPRLSDFNEDLRHQGLDSIRYSTRTQLAPQDVARCMGAAA